MGMVRKFWNTNARPEGWLGRFALRMMNLTHTPMAQWNLVLGLNHLTHLAAVKTSPAGNNKVNYYVITPIKGGLRPPFIG